MRIAIDARELQGRSTGVGRYLAQVLAAWETLPAAQGHQFLPLVPQHPSAGTAWEQLTLPRLVRESLADVLFAPGYTGPIACPVPMVVTMHDVSFAAHPEWFSWREGARRRTLARLTARRAARVLTDSAFSKREILRHLDVEPQRVHVIYPGIPPVAAPAGLPATHAIPEVLYVGSIFARRHVAELMAAFGRLAARRGDATLTIVGDNRSRPPLDVDALRVASGAANRIDIRAYASDAELATFYQRARAFVFLSSYEGFGFTPLEALAAGVPALVLDTPVAREVYGDAVLYVSRPDPQPVADALDLLLYDEHTRTRLLQAVPAVLGRYSWVRCAEQTLHALVAAGSLTA